MATESGVVSGIAGPYAAALFDLALEAGEADDVAADLARLRAMMADSEDLARLVRSPLFSRDDQGRAMAAVLARAEIGELVTKFVGLVSRNRRLFALADMAESYRRRLAAHRGEVVAAITSAQDLSEQHIATLKAELSAAMKTDVTIESRVDEDLIGGMIVRVGSRMLDSSLRTKLQNLRIAMRGVD